MNAALTLSTLTFNLAYSDKTGSERREVSRGVNLPEVLSIKHQPYVDAASKLPGVRSVVRLDRHVAISDGRILPVSAYLVVTVPNDALITSSDVLAAVERIAQVIQEDDSGLDLPDEIFINHEQ
jgi:hypothetical protein